MKELSLVLDQEVQDKAACVADVCGRNLGSLKAPRQAWGALLQALGVKVLSYLHSDEAISVADAATEIVQVAVPEEGDIHPQRADIRPLSHGDIVAVEFVTPGGVTITITAVDETAVKLSFAFGRDSKYLATCIAADLFRHAPRVASQLLASAAAEAVENYEK